MLSTLDDLLIDGIYQPILDLGARHFGATRDAAHRHALAATIVAMAAMAALSAAAGGPDHASLVGYALFTVVNFGTVLLFFALDGVLFPPRDPASGAAPKARAAERPLRMVSLYGWANIAALCAFSTLDGFDGGLHGTDAATYFGFLSYLCIRACGEPPPAARRAAAPPLLGHPFGAH